MFNWALAFFILALVAAMLGAGGVVGALASIGQFIFFVAIVLFTVAIITGGFRDQY